MSSGFGHRTILGRCYPLYMEFKECVSTDFGPKCKDLQEDYLECLHHKKEVNRFNALNETRRKKEAAGEPTPKLVSEQVASGELKVPWTNASS